MKKNNLIFLSIIIFGAVALGVIGLFICLGVKKSDRKPSGNVVVMPSEDIVSDNDGNKLNDGDFHPMPTGMLFAPSALANTQNEEMTVNVVATITPNDAANKAVDWTVAFVNATSAWANGKTATDYITAEPTTDGALTVAITCKEAFGEQIKITVTSRDNPEASASCMVDDKQQFEGYLFSASQTGKTPTLNNSTKKGTIYADFETTEQLKITYSYKKSSVYTVALNDSEITAPATLDVSIDDDSLKEAMNAAKSGSGDAFMVTPTDKVFTMDLFNRKLVENATPAQIAQLRQNLRFQQLSQEPEMGNSFNFMELDNEFHRLMFHIAQKDNTMRMLEGMTIHFDRVRALALTVVKDQKVIDDHRQICDAIERRDVAAAQEIMTKHLTRVKVDEASIRQACPEYIKT